MKITTRKIAETAGVSPASVSRYFNGTESVSCEISYRIEEAIYALGGENMKRKSKKKLILLLLSHMELDFYSCAVRDLLRQEGEYGFLLLRCDVGTPKLLKRLISRMQPAGAVYFEEDLNPALLHILKNAGVRTVMCGGAAAEQTVDTVRVNDLAAAYDGAEYLLDMGHRDILFLCGESKKIGAGYQRLSGCRKAMEERGLAMSMETVHCGLITFETGYKAVCEALKRGGRFTAVFAFSDELAVGALAALHDAGIEVPREVSVLGFDDLEIAGKVRPALTTIHQPMDGFVQKTMELLTRPGETLRAELLLAHKIVERASCAPAALSTNLPDGDASA